METEILFWSRSGEHSWLSNMAIDPFTDEAGTEWRTVEHFYQAQKASYEPDRKQIQAAPSPFEAKRLGGRLSRIQPNWSTYRVTAMRRALALRFRARSASAERLLATGNRALIHNTPWGRVGDPFWGNGRDGRGRNTLGVLLMERRETLRTLRATTPAG